MSCSRPSLEPTTTTTRKSLAKNPTPDKPSLTKVKKATKKAIPKKATPKKATPKKASPKKASYKKASPKKASPKKASPKKAAAKKKAFLKKASLTKAVVKGKSEESPLKGRHEGLCKRLFHTPEVKSDGDAAIVAEEGAGSLKEDLLGSDAETQFYGSDAEGDADGVKYSLKDLVALASSFSPANLDKKRKKKEEEEDDQTKEEEDQTKEEHNEAGDNEPDEAALLATAVAAHRIICTVIDVL
jgi:hypothetical protein